MLVFQKNSILSRNFLIIPIRNKWNSSDCNSYINKVGHYEMNSLSYCYTELLNIEDLLYF